MRVEAARTLIDATPHRREEMEMAAFMDIFHPGHPSTDELVRDARRKRETG